MQFLHPTQSAVGRATNLLYNASKVIADTQCTPCERSYMDVSCLIDMLE